MEKLIIGKPKNQMSRYNRELKSLVTGWSNKRFLKNLKLNKMVKKMDKRLISEIINCLY